MPGHHARSVNTVALMGLRRIGSWSSLPRMFVAAAATVAVSLTLSPVSAATSSPPSDQTSAPTFTSRAVGGTASVTEPRIVGGVSANRAQTPWFVLLNPIIGGQGLACGGTAIAQHSILTAAHCVTRQDGSPMSTSEVYDSGAYVNPVSINSAADLGPRLEWQSVTVNPNFNRGLLVGDIALVHTFDPLSVWLPFSSDRSGPSSGTALQVFGFGATSYGGPLNTTLRMGNVLDVAGVAGPCGQYGSFYHADSEECAGFPPGPTDSCQGDSGGPLTATAQTADRVAVGVVSYGVDCGRPGYPGVYTRVASFANWIQEQTGAAPNSSLVGSHSGPALSVAKSCRGTKKKPCKLKRGGRLLLRLGNAGGTAANWSVAGSNVRASASAGSLASGASVVVKLITRKRKRTCTVVSISDQLGRVAWFRLSLNGGRCR